MELNFLETILLTSNLILVVTIISMWRTLNMIIKEKDKHVANKVNNNQTYDKDKRFVV